MKLKVRDKVFRTFSSSIPYRQTNLEIQIIDEIVFYVLLLEQNTTKKGQVDENNTIK